MGENAGATAGGNVISQGGTSVKERGVCFSITQDPNTSSDKVQIGSGTGTFSYDLKQLAKGTIYYLKAYAINDGGTAYGSEVSFKTKSDPVVPTVITAEVISPTTTTAVCGGNVTSDGDATMLARGVCWDVNHNPDLADVHTIDPAGTGVFVSNITGLTGGTTYYVRAYATNSVGSSYGEEKSFTTLPVQPTVTTNTVTSVAYNSAVCGGNVANEGGAPVTTRGVCWSTSQNPTTSNSKTTDGAGGGTFVSSLTGLSPSTNYFARAYAINSAGTSYGGQQPFTTPAAPYITVTSPVATDHWMELENRIITWSSNVTGTVTLSLYKASSLTLIIVTGTTNDGSHTWTLPDNLVYGSDYKIRVTSVVNSSVYGESPLFKISESTGSTGTVGDSDGNTYNTVKIGKLWWTKQNLKTTRYNDYSFIGSQLNPGIWITLTYAAYCYYESNTTNLNTYGALYNWYAVSSGKLCPAGWHVPSMAEWEELFVFAGGETVAGGKLKEAGTIHWLTPNTSADNAYGFTALPGGFLIDSKGYGNLQQTGFFWTSTMYSSTHSSYLKMEYNLAGIVKNNAPKYGGMSVRCVRD